MSGEKSQIEKFREAMREFGADADGDAYEAAVERVAKAPKLSDDEIKELAKRMRKSKRNAG
jgi:DNA-directed RNA polymerase sigma subunit (sigma70/sigma32)